MIEHWVEMVALRWSSAGLSFAPSVVIDASRSSVPGVYASASSVIVQDAPAASCRVHVTGSVQGGNVQVRLWSFTAAQNTGSDVVPELVPSRWKVTVAGMRRYSSPCSRSVPRG